MFNERKAAFKAPPASMRDKSLSQDVRRTKALEEQKRRRAERIDSTRQLDFFADMTLGPSDDEADDADDAQTERQIVREGISHFASMLPSSTPSTTDSTSASQLPQAPFPHNEPENEAIPDVHMKAQPTKRSKNKRKGKARAGDPAKGKKHVKPSKWADKCMYAELLEMSEGFDASGDLRDGIPDDIETGWVAVTPVPVGKRCLAVTHQTSGIAGVVPNTTIRSRVLGKPLMKPFPSTLPPQTVLDCILDENWRDNGILHILDVVTWKGQDLADCETPFRFWWRDTRLSELSPFPPPPNAAPPEKQATTYQFPHPTTFAPVPYHTDTTLSHLLTTLIPLTRSTRTIPISVPVLTGPSSSDDKTATMDLDGMPVVQLRTAQAEVHSDGLLLYVAQATYEPGTSPLSSWVPLRAYETHEERMQREAIGGPGSVAESPLGVFERLIKRRVQSGIGTSVPDVDMAP
ncbi:hypothetical protein PYCCODRAFT_352329 [Trametes coccinea BRFM310]|uniref:Snurportin-1 n=1 Tax=Trametes coccinea (strain BRFM310) TaxID=1353009 RepID=A0A1Y2J6G1_TRAC3|nr:hypothetical protein PYCCODRAFT_352329 [Trametes coccinea BRFM310]